MTNSGIRTIGGKGVKSVLILAGSPRRAGQIADARGIPRAQVAFPRTLQDAESWAPLSLPLIVDWSLPSHREGVMLAEFAAAYIWREAPIGWRKGARRDQ